MFYQQEGLAINSSAEGFGPMSGSATCNYKLLHKFGITCCFAAFCARRSRKLEVSVLINKPTYE